jgi:hypothetical protein
MSKAEEAPCVAPSHGSSLAPPPNEPLDSSSLEGRGDSNDPEIEALLDFEPVPRKREVEGAWTPALQREFIARLAVTGSPGRAAEEMGKDETGVRKLYRTPEGASFREAWDAAVDLARRRKAEGGPAERAVAPGSRPPSLDHRRKHPDPVDLPDPELLERDGEPSEEQKLEFVEHLAGLFMKKVAAERRARLNGEIVAADFYLRQITMLEVLFDLTVSDFHWKARDFLRNLRRGGLSPLEIVSTPFADWLDVQRRIWWLQEGDPERPPHPDARFVREHKDGPWGSRGDEGYSTSVDASATGAMTTPARGYSAEEWRQMNCDQQRVARQLQFDVDSEQQREWERRAHEEWEASEHAVRARAEREHG